MTRQAGATARTPLVSVVIPVYNHERFVGDAVRSVLAQTYRNLEVIAIDDGSTDASLAVVRSIGDARLRILTQPNRGAHRALNRGLGLARGQYVSVLNSDDRYHPARIARLVEVCERDRSVEACFTHIDVIDENDRVVGHIRGVANNPVVQSGRPLLGAGKDELLALLGGNFLATTSNMFCRRSVLRLVGRFRSFRYAHDYDYFVRLCARQRVRVIDRPLLLYRTHGANTIKESRAAAIFEHLIILSALVAGQSVRRSLRHGDPDTALVKFFNSVDAFGADRILLSLVAAQAVGGRRYEMLCRDLIDNADNAFRKRSLEAIEQLLLTPEERIVKAMKVLGRSGTAPDDLYLFGTGEFARVVIKHLDRRRFRPRGFFDNNSLKIGRRMRGLLIEAPRHVPGARVLVASMSMEPIYRQLRALGYKRRDIVVLEV